MPNPTFNKYKSTTIFGNLSVRDLTNQAGTSVVEVASVDLSGNFLSRGDSTFTKKVICNALLADINANNILTTKQYVDSVGGSSILSSNNTFTGTNTFNNNVFNLKSINQETASRATYINKFIRTDFQEQTTMYSITDVRNSNLYSSLRVAQGDYPYLSSNSPYTTPQVFTIAAQQTITGSQINISQATTTATNTADYAIPNTIISSFTIPTNFSKFITLNIPISLRNAGTWTITGTALNATITNTINSMTATIILNGVSVGTEIITEQNENSLTRSTTISYTTTGTKTIALDQYFFNINVDTSKFLNDTYMGRDNSISNVVQVLLSMNITNEITRISNAGIFTATNTLTLVANTSTQTISNTGTAPTTISYTPNSNGTDYAAATSTSVHNDPTLTTGGTTYTNHLRANTFNLLPEGMIIQYTGSTAPYGWLLCDGSIYNASTNKQYQALFNVIGIQFGGTDNTDFQVPDYRGAFLRGAGTNGKAGYTTYVGQTINTPETHATQTHTHTINHTHTPNRHSFRVRADGLSGVGFDIISSFPTGLPQTTTGLSVPSFSGSSGNNTGNTNANETRPFNYSVNYLIKY